MMVSALMVTQPGREAFALAAEEDFRAQGYRDKELVTVMDDGRTLGKLRNASVALASGDAVMIWDDDDRHGPGRMARQVDALGDADACFLDQVTLLCACGFQALSMPRVWGPTMLARKDRLPRYRDDLETHEDIYLCRELQQGAVSYLHAPETYTKVYHRGNTMSRRHYQKLFAQQPTEHTCSFLTG